jgi:hypothetical protein
MSSIKAGQMLTTNSDPDTDGGLLRIADCGLQCLSCRAGTFIRVDKHLADFGLEL